MRFALKFHVLLLVSVLLPATTQAIHLAVGTRVLSTDSAKSPVIPPHEASDLSAQAGGELGTITDGPVSDGVTVWWQVHYDSGHAEWTEEAALVEAYFPPPESAGGWRSLVPRNTTPSSAQIAAVREKAGLDWHKLRLARDYSNSLSSGSAVLVIRNGWIAGEWGSTSSLTVASVTKSLTGLAMGKLFDLSNTGQLPIPIIPESAVYQYLPAEFGDSDPLKKRIEVKDFMTMSSGIQSADSSAVTLTLDQALTYPMSALPEEGWSYVSLPVNLLSIVVQNLSGTSLQNFFATHIANPIGAPVSSWGTWAGYTTAAGQAKITGRNLARIGYLTLRQGQWDNGTGLKQIISRDSIALLTSWAPFLAATTSFESVPPFFGPDPESHHYYGHLFWTNRLQHSLGINVPEDAYYMHGFRDNLCIVIPSLDMVVIRLASSGPGMAPEFRSEFMTRIMAAIVPASSSNQQPTVNAGPNQTVTLPNSINLNGSLSDDGLPNPPATVTTTWSKVSGPGTVTFANANAVVTTASFNAAGSYVLQLTASDGASMAQDQVGITVNAASGTVTIIHEAESGSLTAPMAVRSDAAASGGVFVEVPEASGNNYSDVTSGGPGQVSFSISIPQPTTYALWARTIGVNGTSRSFYVLRNGILLKEWTVPLATTWTWSKIGNVSLTGGTLNLAFRQREDGTKLDQVLVTSDLGLVPSAAAQLLADAEPVRH